MILFDLSPSIIESLRNNLPGDHRVISWPFCGWDMESSENLLPRNELHLRAWRERYKSDFEELSMARVAGRFEQLIDLTCDRVFVDPISSNDRILYLARLETLIRSEIQKIGPGMAIFASTPHFPWDLMCAKVLLEGGHRVYSFRPTQVDGRILVQEHLLSGHLTRFLSRDELSELPSNQEMVLADSLFNQHGVPVSTRVQFAQNLVSSDRVGPFVVRASKALIRRMMSKFLRGQTSAAESSRGNYFDIYSGGMYRLLQARRMASASRNNGILRALSTDQVPRKYVLFMLHFQPERTTDPEAGLARYQVSALVELRKRMDSEGMETMMILVKEHPRQMLRFDLDARRLLARSAAFYETIAGLHNCSLVDPKVDSESLIAGANLVVTPNGTAAWEALLKGRPGITFAETWHSTCGASPNWDAVKNGEVSLRQLLSMNREAVVGSVKKFAETERFTHAGVMDERHAKAGDLVKLQSETARLLVDLAALRVRTEVLAESQTA